MLSIDWDVILARHGQMVIQAAMRILGCQSDAEDVAQEVFMEAFSSAKVPSRLPIRNWGAYLRKLAVFRAIDRRRQRSKNSTTSVDNLALPGFSAHDEAVRQELKENLRALVAALPEREGVVFALRYFEQLSNPEIAESLGISVGAVAAAIHKARSKLESTLTTHTEGDK
ncbi:sigma-70 family RNA polymerase sigma factor [Telmatocola sphagniphila]|uniref:Sigma-70 family RNA polymerase sigma factor n=1 Tax=Telmatocola sphagniphila TaxID=1123043 RepID=A0A8E6B477_9BACT|nr:sigma-70 family RNA polymerase sigma factor [Telmatocola sphagniphila]QVL30999.1 sigma-70 family RNA polymerase sigma factor [Telmatocola sphagniphila]